MGNPYFTGDLEGWAPDGQPLLADPPLRSRHLAAVSGRLAIETQSEVWITEDDVVRRIAGDEREPELQYQPSGACEDVRLIIGDGIAPLPSGNLVVIDTAAHGVIELADPFGACTASPIAGAQEPILDVDVADALFAGDVDGPGAQSKFHAPQRPTSDGDGNIYLHDSGNSKIKRIANDADRTVSTVLELDPDDSLLAMTAMDGKLYVTGGSVASEDFVLAVDPETGTLDELFRGRGLFEELDSSQMATMFALAHDGTDLFVASQKGYVFRLSTAGDPLGVIAGMGTIVDFPADLDLTAPIALDRLPLRSYAPNDASLVRLGDDFMFTGNAAGVGFHVWAIHCG
jgi:hypothetical protein